MVDDEMIRLFIGRAGGDSTIWVDDFEGEEEELEFGEMTDWVDPSPPKEPRDPEAIRRYCGRTSVSGRESSNRS
jgi:hypothetical protein